MTQLLSFLLSLILQFGYPIIIAVVFLGELGIPLPVSTLLLAAGSFTVDGTLNMYILLPLVAITAIIGDSIGYIIGKQFGETFVTYYFRKSGLTPKRIERIENLFRRWGMILIFLSRFVLTPLCIPINLFAGMSEFPFWRFFAMVVIGEIIWASTYLYLGYVFGVNWMAVSSYIGNTPWIIVLLIVGITSLFIAAKIKKKRK